MHVLLFLRARQVPSVLEDKHAIPGRPARPVVIGSKDSQMGCVFYRISLRFIDIQRHRNFVFARNKRKARDFADKNLFPHSLSPSTVRLEDAMGGENPLTK